jgi:hypothetical protein
MQRTTALIASAIIVGTALLTPAASQARPWGWHGGWGWHHGWGPGWGWGAAGVGAGLAAGVLAAPYYGPGYAYGYGYRPCLRRVWGPYGWHLVRVC